MRRVGALLIAIAMVGACLPIAGPGVPIESPYACQPPNLFLPQSAPAYGGYDAQPGPKIGETQPILVSYPSYCYPSAP